jgi:hypothetical protein
LLEVNFLFLDIRCLRVLLEPFDQTGSQIGFAWLRGKVMDDDQRGGRGK